MSCSVFKPFEKAEVVAESSDPLQTSRALGLPQVTLFDPKQGTCLSLNILEWHHLLWAKAASKTQGHLLETVWWALLSLT